MSVGTDALSRKLQEKKQSSENLPVVLEKLKPQIQLALPTTSQLTPDRVIRIALTEIKRNNDLLKCDPGTLCGSIIYLTQLGLEIGIGGQGYLVPYKNVCTPIIGWQGYNELLHRAGKAYIKTGAVYEGDEFDYTLNRGIALHKAGPDNGLDPLKITHFYAEGYLKHEHQPVVVEVWSVKRMLLHRDTYNKVGEKHYSFKHFEAYGRKVMFLQAIKMLPKSSEIQRAMVLDDDREERPVIDLKNLDGSWDFISDAEVVDTETGEIIGYGNVSGGSGGVSQKG